MLLRLIYINLVRAALQLRDDLVCNDPEIHDQCLAECRLSYLECRANCDSQLCDSDCLAEFQECESTCPCGRDCPAGCRDCIEHPLCQDECQDAQLNNLDYQVCLNNAVNKLEICLKTCPADIECHNSCYASYTEQLILCPCFDKDTTTTTAEISTTTTTTTTETTNESTVFILVIPHLIDESFLQIGSSQISAKINAPDNEYAWFAAFALVNGELYIFGGHSDSYKIARLDGCSLNELPARLNEQRRDGHAAVSFENGRKALVCFGHNSDMRKSCEIFDGLATAPTFTSERTHKFGGLGLFKNQPATVGCDDAEHRKTETLSGTGWTELPDFPLRISDHSLVGLVNGAMLLLGGYDRGSYSGQTGIWELKEEEWSKIGKLSQPAAYGSAIYVSRSVYYFDSYNWAIYRVDLDENEELEAVEEIGTQPQRLWFPVLFHLQRQANFRRSFFTCL